MDDFLHRGPVAPLEQGRALLDELEEGVILDQGRLHRLRQAAAPIAIRQGREKRRIVDHGERRSERAEVVLLAERVDPVLDPDRRIILRQHRRGEPDEANPAMRHRGRVADHVQHGAAADRPDIRMAIERCVMDGLQHRVGRAMIVLALLAAGNQHDRRRQFERARVIAAVLRHPALKPRMRLGHAAVEYEQHPGRFRRDRARRRLEHQRVRGHEHVPAEVDGIPERDADLVF
jgi:hypothetical protein